ncbi:MAG: alpha/beta hydrolase, partial [candidate division Zixibacteria bacterium]|nr:alpha/beta hydrolase [candidate division Zixibacteria bacterium]
MRRLSPETKEIIYIVAFLLVAAVVVSVYVVYPLSVVKATFGRSDIETFNPDSLQAIDLTRWTQYGLKPETLRVATDGKTDIACYYIRKWSPDSTKGTVLILHGGEQNADSFVVFSRLLSERGYHVITCDMRAVRSSGGKYRSDGQLEATDAEELLSSLFVKGDITEPLIVVGFGIGGSAALIAASEESRINHVYAVDPALETSELIERYRLKNDNCWFPGYNATMWWWWEMRSGYTIPSRSAETFPTPLCPSTIFVLNNESNDQTLKAYQARSANPMAIERAGDKE